ncbi:MAG: PKD domain-containing protein, partial [Kiritimatiellota bacterium]|nr:PKD domain-containing protein [Kiritimatiellota bacterium]
EWDFGDGATASGMIATHTYADNDIYVAKLSTTVHQPGGVTTRQFAKVIAHNVPPVVNAGPDLTIDEGQEVEFSAAFNDQEWPDQHTAIFDFGDDTLPANGTVSETNNQPRAVGTAKAKHAYCDNGEYTLTVEVTDDDGGVGTDMRKVTVRNVPPKVDAGDDPFAYPGFPISLEACFTDPGWCDTHTATWEFGDCTPPSPAVVHESNDPPAAVGVAAAIHVYQRCGTYLACCVVTDDDGGSGEDCLHVRVVELQNSGFEGGFHARRAGVVANGWELYTLGASEMATSAEGRAAFEAEEFIVHSGQRSQKIFGVDKFCGGIYQSIGANPGWDYQVSAWYHLDQHGGGVCRLGIDPEGSTNPDSAAVIWSQGGEHRNWAELLVRVTAKARQVTVFLEMDAKNQSAV